MNEQKHPDIVYQIYTEMLNHVGADNAIPAKELSGKFGISERKLREYVSEMRRNNDFDKLVMSGNDGYFICTDAEEFNRAVQRLLSAAFDLLKTARAAEKKAGRNGQVKLKLDELSREFCEPFAASENTRCGD